MPRSLTQHAGSSDGVTTQPVKPAYPNSISSVERCAASRPARAEAGQRGYNPPMRNAAIAVVLLLLVATADANEIRIHATVAIEMTGDCANAVGFAMEAGPAADSGKVRKQVQEQARAKYPQARNKLHADNFMKDKYVGNHAVVVAATITKPGCSGRAMGVGFGKDEAAARKDAERLMGRMFPFNDGKVKVEFSKAF